MFSFLYWWKIVTFVATHYLWQQFNFHMKNLLLFHKGMIFASKALALTMVDLFESEELRGSIRKEFEERRGGEKHKAMVPDGPPPVLKKGD